MNRKAELKEKIYELDFALHELNLFLDTHPTNAKALNLIKEYRRKRQEFIAVFESNFGKYTPCVEDIPCEGCWNWLKGPWPWENNFMEE